MLTVDMTSPLINAMSGENIDNGDGTISVQMPPEQPGGAPRYLSIDSTGAIKFATSIGPDEKFKFSGSALVATNTYEGTKVWMLPCVETV